MIGGNWNAGLHCHTDRREAWSPTRMHAGAGKCTPASTHRCYSALFSPLCSSDQACAHRPNKSSTVVMLMLVFVCLELPVMSFPVLGAPKQKDTKVEEDVLEKLEEAPQRTRMKRIIMRCYVSHFITLIAQHNPVLEGCTGALGRSLCQDLEAQVSLIP